MTDRKCFCRYLFLISSMFFFIFLELFVILSHATQQMPPVSNQDNINPQRQERRADFGGRGPPSAGRGGRFGGGGGVRRSFEGFGPRRRPFIRREGPIIIGDSPSPGRPIIIEPPSPSPIIIHNPPSPVVVEPIPQVSRCIDCPSIVCACRAPYERCVIVPDQCDRCGYSYCTPA